MSKYLKRRVCSLKISLGMVASAINRHLQESISLSGETPLHDIEFEKLCEALEITKLHFVEKYSIVNCLSPVGLNGIGKILFDLATNHYRSELNINNEFDERPELIDYMYYVLEIFWVCVIDKINRSNLVILDQYQNPMQMIQIKMDSQKINSDNIERPIIIIYKKPV